MIISVDFKPIDTKIISEWLAVCIIIISFALIGCNSGRAKNSKYIENIIQESIEKISSKKLYRTVKDLQDMGNRYTWEKQEETAEYLKRRLEEYKINVYYDEYSYEKRKWKNVVAKIMGEVLPQEVIMIISHLDSEAGLPESRSPGADDNGSGTAALIEIARVMSGSQPQKSVQFVIFSNEEQGKKGSKHFANKARREGQKIINVINLDIIGYNNPNDSVLSVDRDLIGFTKSVVKAARNQIFKYIYPYGRITVAGRNKNERLIEKVSINIKKYTELSINDYVSDDCG